MQISKEMDIVSEKVPVNPSLLLKVTSRNRALGRLENSNRLCHLFGPSPHSLYPDSFNSTAVKFTMPMDTRQPLACLQVVPDVELFLW